MQATSLRAVIGSRIKFCGEIHHPTLATTLTRSVPTAPSPPVVYLLSIWHLLFRCSSSLCLVRYSLHAPPLPLLRKEKRKIGHQRAAFASRIPHSIPHNNSKKQFLGSPVQPPSNIESREEIDCIDVALLGSVISPPFISHNVANYGLWSAQTRQGTGLDFNHNGLFASQNSLSG